MSSEKRKIAYIDGKPYEIGSNHNGNLKLCKKVSPIFDGVFILPRSATPAHFFDLLNLSYRRVTTSAHRHRRL